MTSILIASGKYQPEKYWNEVADEITERQGSQVIAGDDEPYYRYKRSLFLKAFDTIEFKGKRILEIGSGPGGNLEHLLKKGYDNITGVDISDKMIALARKRTSLRNVKISKTDGKTLPFRDGEFDVVFSSTVLQHITDEAQLESMVSEMCRVSNESVFIFERIEKKIKGHLSNTGRPVTYYMDLFSRNGFEHLTTKFLKIYASYFVCGSIRKVFEKKDKKEGEPVRPILTTLQNLALPFTHHIDKIFPAKIGLGMLQFRKNPRKATT